jgi:hypothetical protein
MMEGMKEHDFGHVLMEILTEGAGGCVQNLLRQCF